MKLEIRMIRWAYQFGVAPISSQALFPTFEVISRKGKKYFIEYSANHKSGRLVGTVQLHTCLWESPMGTI
jgi:hypothetical protein